MRSPLSLIAIVLVVAACLGLAACGSKSSDDVVIRVGANTITAATVDRWIRIESVTSSGDAGTGTKRLPKGVLPVPPDYSACVELLLSEIHVGPKPTRDELRVKCAVRYKVLKETILGILINYYWDAGEGARQGIDVTDAEVTNYLKGEYPHFGELRTHLKVTGATPADERILVRSKLLRVKLSERSARGTHDLAERVHAIAKSIEEESARWTPRTSCSPGYVVSACKQFHGPQT